MSGHWPSGPKDETIQRRAKLLALLTRAANRDEPCPKNDVIVGALGIESTGSVAAYFRRLERDGLIRTEYSGSTERVVEIVKTGKRTAPAEKGDPPVPPRCARIRSLASRLGSAETVAATMAGQRDGITRADIRFRPVGPKGGYAPHRTCQWLHGPGPRWTDADKCGKPVQPGSPYCPQHRARCIAGSVRLDEGAEG